MRTIQCGGRYASLTLYGAKSVLLFLVPGDEGHPKLGGMRLRQEQQASRTRGASRIAAVDYVSEVVFAHANPPSSGTTRVVHEWRSGRPIISTRTRWLALASQYPRVA
jgi:hypothetical protein